MTFSQVLLILRVRWRSALLVFVAVLALVLAANSVQPKRYTATSTVVLDVKSPDPIAGVVLPGMTVTGYMGTQTEVMQSERVLLKATQALGTAKDPQVRADWQAKTHGRGSFESWIAEGMSKRLNVQPGRDSNVLLVSYTDADPDVASKVANAIVNSYIETTLELRTEPAKQYSHLFDESTKSLRDALEAAQTRLSEFQKSSGIVASDEKLDIENTQLAELSSQLVVAQARVADSRGRQQQADVKGDQMQEVVTNQTISKLSTDLAAQESRLKELGERYGDSNPQIQELRANISELRNRLSAERVRVAGSLAINNSVNEANLDQLRSALEKQRAKVVTIKMQRDNALVLQRDIDNAQRAYDAAFARKSQSALESQATQTNVSIIRVATPPPFPSSPRTSLNIAVGVLVGAVLGVMTAVIRERRDWRIRVEDDVIEVLRYPLLGVMPDSPRDHPSQRSAAWRLAVDRVLGRPTPLIGG